MTGTNILEQAAPMSDIIRELTDQLVELRAYKEDAEAGFVSA